MSCLAILLFKYRLESTKLTSNVKHIGGWGVGRRRNWFQNIEVLHPSRLLAFSWPACTGDASHPVCLSHFPGVMSQGETRTQVLELGPRDLEPLHYDPHCILVASLLMKMLRMGMQRMRMQQLRMVQMRMQRMRMQRSRCNR